MMRMTWPITPKTRNLCVFLLCFATFHLLSAQKLYIDAINAEITFEFPTKNIKGTVGGLQVWTADLDIHNLKESYVSGSVAVETIKTKNFFRDKLWQGRKLFSKKKFPRIHFKSESIVKNGDSFVVTGTLKIKETTKRVSLEFMRKDSDIVGLSSINLMDYDVSIFKKRRDNRVNITFQLPVYERTGTVGI